jgi:hypothetical protein
VLLALLATGCQKLFGLDPVGAGTADAAIDGAPDVAIDAAPAHVCFVVAFDSNINASQFDVTQPPQGGSVGVSSNQAQIAWPNGKSGDNYGAVHTASTFDLSGGDVQLDVNEVFGDMAEGELLVQLDATHIYEITISPSAIEYDLYDGSTSFTVLHHVNYAGGAVHVRIASDDVDDQIVFEATVGVDTDTWPIATAFSVQTVTLGFAAGTYGAALNSGYAFFDNFTASSRNCLGTGA